MDGGCVCRFENNLRKLAEGHLKATNGIRRTPKQLTYVDKWGTLRHACGVSAVLAGFARGLRRRSKSGSDRELADQLMWFSERQVCPY